jgi:K(+)-stimulated pyrophosphate-energized sodium pump
MNPVIKFTTLFGLLAVELALELESATNVSLAVVFGLIMLYFVWRSFYGMRIGSETSSKPHEAARAPAEST